MTHRWISYFLLAVSCVGSSLAAAEGPLDGFDRFFEADGSFRFPGASARDGLVHLGSWYVPEGDARGFHHVYTQPQSLAAYRATGEFPDGAVLLKELRRATKAHYTTGKDVASATEIVQRFLMVKDRYPDVPAFGGFCAYGVSVGKKFDGDPRFWTITGDKLYVNLNGEISRKFKEDVSGAVRKADMNWKKIEHKPVGDL